MAIEIWDGSAWVESSDPKVYYGESWTSVQKGEIYTGSGWSVFYLRVTPVSPTISLNARTSTSITVNVSAPSGTPYKTQITVWRTGNLPGSVFPASPAVGAIADTFTQTGLSSGVSYTFNAYTTYYDASTNSIVAQSPTTTFTVSTLAVTVQSPTITLNSRTVSSITVNVTLPTGSPYKTQVSIFRNDNPFGLQEIPATPAVGAISGTFVQTGLSSSTSYTFSATAQYYDAVTNDPVGTSSTTTATFSTLAYTLTVPTTPTNTSRGQYTLTFQSTSNANFSINGTSAVIRFYLEELTGFGWLPASPDSQLDSASFTGDSNTTRSVTFSGLNSGESYRCRAATYWAGISETSAVSAWSATVTTQVLTPTTTPYAPLSNRTYFTSASSATASSSASGSSPSNASDGSTSTVWYSDPFESTQVLSGNTNVSCSEVERAFGVAVYVPSSNFNGTPVNATVASLSYIRYDPLRRWTFDSFGSRYTFIYIAGSIAATDADNINVYSLAAGVNGTNQNVIAKDTYTISGTSYTRVSLLTPSANLAGSESNPVLVSGSYCTFTTFGGGTSVSTLAFSTTKTARAESSTSELWITDSRTPNLSPRSTSNGSITYRYYYYPAKGTGTETLTLNFAVNTTTYPNARMLSTDGIYVLNDGIATQSFTLQKLEDAGGGNGVWTSVASAILGPNISDTYPSGGLQIFNISGTNYFSFRLVCNRFSSGSGYFTSIKEVAIRFTYDVIV